MDAVVEIAEATAQLDELVDRAAGGHRVIVTRSGMPVAMLVPFDGLKLGRPFGLDRGKVIIRDDFDDPLPEFEEWLEKPLFPE